MKNKIKRWLGVEQHIDDLNAAIALLQVQLGAVANRQEATNETVAELQETVEQLGRNVAEFMQETDYQLDIFKPAKKTKTKKATAKKKQ